MLSWPRVLVVLVAGAAVPTLALSACQPNLPSVGQLCGEIPGDGCPKDRGGSCDDPTCSAVYTCLNGNWKLDQTCSGDRDAGPDAEPLEAGADADAGATDGCTPFKFDDKDQAPHCEPSLENPPDCPSQAAEGCLESACITGCSDFFLCTKHGWIDVGYCDDDGGFHDTQPK
jgi:hypothetical protein